jgi:hypothetical protein
MLHWIMKGVLKRSLTITIAMNDRDVASSWRRIKVLTANVVT